MINEIVINNTNGELTVPSIQVAKNFGKQHKNVIQAIENLVAENSAAKSFYKISTHEDRGKSYKCYDMTRDGFSLLVMGFTGSKALEWKLKYIEAFNIMETKLSAVNAKASLLLDIYNGGEAGVIASKKLVEIETQPLVEKIKRDKPFVDFAEHIQKTDGSIDMAEMAKCASKHGMNIGRNGLFKFLRANKILMSNNVPYQKYIDNGWFEVIEVPVSVGGIKNIKLKTLVKPKGQMAILKKLKQYD